MIQLWYTVLPGQAGVFLESGFPDRLLFLESLNHFMIEKGCKKAPMSQQQEERKPRYVSLEGCKIIGQGKHGRVYQLNDEQIIKIYYDKTAADQIEAERRNGREAFVQRVPSCITFDMVQTDLGYGIIFELAGEPHWATIFHPIPKSWMPAPKSLPS